MWWGATECWPFTMGSLPPSADRYVRKPFNCDFTLPLCKTECEEKNFQQTLNTLKLKRYMPVPLAGISWPSSKGYHWSTNRIWSKGALLLDQDKMSSVMLPICAQCCKLVVLNLTVSIKFPVVLNCGFKGLIKGCKCTKNWSFRAQIFFSKFFSFGCRPTRCFLLLFFCSVDTSLTLRVRRPCLPKLYVCAT